MKPPVPTFNHSHTTNNLPTKDMPLAPNQLLTEGSQNFEEPILHGPAKKSNKLSPVFRQKLV